MAQYAELLSACGYSHWELQVLRINTVLSQAHRLAVRSGQSPDVSFSQAVGHLHCPHCDTSQSSVAHWDLSYTAPSTSSWSSERTGGTGEGGSGEVLKFSPHTKNVRDTFSHLSITVPTPELSLYSVLLCRWGSGEVLSSLSVPPRLSFSTLSTAFPSPRLARSLRTSVKRLLFIPHETLYTCG